MEEGDSSYEDILKYGKRILPTDRSKYVGSVWHNKKHNKWLVRFGVKYRHLPTASFDSEAEADAYIQKINIEENLPIRNIIYVFEDSYYCMLTQGKLMKFSSQHIKVVQSRTWCVQYKSGSYYPYTHINREDDDGKIHRMLISFPRALYPYLDETVCILYRNKDTLDNTEENLVIVPVEKTRIAYRPVKRKRIVNPQGISLDAPRIAGVFYDVTQKAWLSKWIDDNNVPQCKAFKIEDYGDSAYDQAVALRSQNLEERKVPQVRPSKKRKTA